MKKKIKLPDHVIDKMQLLENNNFEVYLVGGSVRDYLFDKNVSDFDFATSATPLEIKRIFQNYKIMDYGEEHGTVSIYSNGHTYEITTFRKEEGYSDGRRPDNVEFVKDLRSDLSRRDFTINALAADKSGNIIDYYGGLEDFDQQIIRAVGDPSSRFQEDSLRLLRAARFSLRLEFRIESKTRKAIKKNGDLLKKHEISGERILTELEEIFEFSSQAILLLHDLRLLEILFNEIYSLHNNKRLLEIITKFSPNQRQIWALLIYYSSTDGINQNGKLIFEKYPGKNNQYQRIVIEMADSLDYTIDLLEFTYLERVLYWMKITTESLNKYPEFEPKSYLHDLTTLANGIQTNSNFKTITKIIENKIHRITGEISINGYDIKNRGYTGRSIGATLEELRDYFIFTGINQKSKFLEVLKRWENSKIVSPDNILAETGLKKFTKYEKNSINKKIMNRIIIKSKKFNKIIFKISKEHLDNLIDFDILHRLNYRINESRLSEMDKNKILKYKLDNSKSDKVIIFDLIDHG